MSYRLRDRDGRTVTVEGAHLADDAVAADLVVELAPGRLRPGLLNAHDHLHRNHYPRLGSPPYGDAYEWGRHIHEHHGDEIGRARGVSRHDALLFGALKNLLAGVTAVVHHDPWEPAFERDFPVRVARIGTAHSLGFDRDGVEALAERDAPICVHVAEGTTAAARAEVRDLDRLGLLDRRLVAVHAVGVDDADADLLAERGVCVVWCPTSNDFLFGRTAPAKLLRSVDVLVGSDSLLTADGTLLDELRAARAVGALTDAALLAAVGSRAAERLGAIPPRLEPGMPADVAVFDRPVLEATAEDVRLVVVGGVPRLADVRYEELFRHVGVDVEEIRVGGATKLVAAPLGGVARRIVSEWPEAGRILLGRSGAVRVAS